MPFFWKPYTSDVTDFIKELKARKPTLEAEQRAGRGLLWDRPQDRAFAEAARATRLRQPPYVYQTQPETPPQQQD